MDKKTLICLTLVSKNFYIPVPFALVTIIKTLANLQAQNYLEASICMKNRGYACSVMQETVYIYLKESSYTHLSKIGLKL